MKNNYLTLEEKTKEFEKDRYEQELVKSVIEDFKKRQDDKRAYEAQWQLNMNFLIGNQFCYIGPNGEIEDYDSKFNWQEKEVFNHIAQIVDVRLAKLGRVRPSMTVVPASGDERDIKTAKISKKIVNSIYNKLELSELISEATRWSEICGTAFYKVTWNSNRGHKFGNDEKGSKVYGGDVEISVCSPFEIFPDNTNAVNISDCRSIIHAKAVHVDEIKNIWGVEVKGEDVNIFSLDLLGSNGSMYNGAGVIKSISGTRNNHAVIIEKYEKPTKEFQNGRLIIIAGGKLLYDGELPYETEVGKERGFPFIKQSCLEQVGSFWGISVIERIIPIQRVYNTIKNRKHEFINRLSMGVLTVEDGSVDVENLEDEGLSPGKIITYRQGSNPPSFLNFTRVPFDFSAEEDKILNEFMLISGVSDLMRNTALRSANISGTALQILIEQDDTRISVTSEIIRNAIKLMAQRVLRLYKQFATMPRISKVIGDNGEIEVFYFSSSDISSDDIIFETITEIGETIAQKRNMVFELLSAGLLQDENGKLSNRMRVKALELLGFGVWENAQDINELHIKKASLENFKLLENRDGELSLPLEIDDHDIHITEHTAFVIGKEFSENKNSSNLTEKMLEHIRSHKKMKSLQIQAEAVISENKN